MKKYFNILNIRLILIFALALFLFSFANTRNQNRKLQRSEVIFEGENTNFIKQEIVNKLLIDYKLDAKSIKKVSLNLKNTEKTLDSNPMIEKSEVYVSVDGVLKARVVQKTPIGRVFADSDSYYIDYQGKKMPLSDEETARVPLVFCNTNFKVDSKLVDVLKIIYDDKFLSKNITNLQIQSDQSIILLNRNYDFKILFGQAVNIENKFKNYKAFYQKASENKVLEKYKSINLTFNHQVVAVK